MEEFPYFRKISKNISVPVNALGLTETENTLYKAVMRMSLNIERNWPIKDLEEITGFHPGKIRRLRKKLLLSGVLKRSESLPSAIRNPKAPKFMEMVISYSQSRDHIFIWLSKRTLRLIEVSEESNDKLEYNKRIRIIIENGKITISADKNGLRIIGRRNQDTRYMIFKKEEWFRVCLDHKKEKFPVSLVENKLISCCPSWILLGSGCTSISIPIE